MDKASNFHRSETRLILANLDRVIVKYALMYDFNTSNNAAEYEALVADLKIAKVLQVQKLTVFLNS